MKTKLLTLMLGLLTTTMSAQQFGAANLRVSAAGADGDNGVDAYDPTAAYSITSSKYLVVWEADDTNFSLFTGEKEIIGQFINADGTEDGVDFIISGHLGTGTAADYIDNPDVVWNSDLDQFLIVYVGDTDLTNGKRAVYGIILDNNGATLKDSFKISTMGGDLDGATDVDPYASVAYNATDGEYLVVWNGQDDVLEGTEMWGRRVAANGDLLGTDDIKMTNTPVTDLVYTKPRVAWNEDNNNYLVVFKGKISGATGSDYEIHGQIIGADGSVTIGNIFRISNNLGAGPNYLTTDSVEPDVVYNTTEDEFYVVWNGTQTEKDGASEVWGRRVSGTGTPQGSDVKLTTIGYIDHTALDVFAPKVVFNAGINTYSVSFHADHIGSSVMDMYLQNVSAAGSPIGPMVYVSDAGGGVASTANGGKDGFIASDGGQKTLVCWEGWGADLYGYTGLGAGEFEIFRQMYDVLTLGVSEDIILNGHLNVYPNPNNGQFSVSYKGDSALEKLSVFDITGRMVQSIDLQNANSETINVNLEGVSQGMYVLQIYTKNASVTKKIIIR